MTTAQYYATAAEVIQDLKLNGIENELDLMKFIKSASQYIMQTIGLGSFIPITDTKLIDGTGSDTLLVMPILSIDALIYQGATLADATDFYLYGRAANQPHWEDGAFIRVTKLSGVWSNERANVSLAGKFGLYNRSTALAISVITLSDSAITLDVSNGAKLSPGMILIVEDEQIAIESTNTTPTALASQLGVALARTDDVALSVTDASEFNQGEVIQIDLEDMKIIRINTATNMIAVKRGYNQTALADHALNAAIGVYRTFDITRAVNGTTAATHTATAAAQQAPPADINYLARQMAALEYKKAETQYSGRQGNAETGETFYFSEFPTKAIKAARRAYNIQVF